MVRNYDVVDVFPVYSKSDTRSERNHENCSATRDCLRSEFTGSVYNKVIDIYIKFSNDISLSGCTGGVCPEVEGGSITSPNFRSSNYPPKQSINYTLETYLGSKIELNFDSFLLEYSEDCQHDSVRLTFLFYRYHDWHLFMKDH